MLYVDACTGEMTRFEVRCLDGTVTSLLQSWFAHPDPAVTSGQVVGAESDPRAAPPEVPSIAISFGASDAAPILEATFAGATLRLRAQPDVSTSPARLRRGTVLETLALGVSWSLGVHRVGCFDPISTIFPGERVEAEGWILDLHGGFDHALDEASLGARPPRARLVVQIWCGTGLPQPRRVDAVSALFGAQDADAWATLDPLESRSGQAHHPHVLVAALTQIEGPAPSREVIAASRGQAVALQAPSERNER